MSKEDIINEILQLKKKSLKNQELLKAQQQSIHEAKSELSRHTSRNNKLIRDLEQLKIGAQEKRKVLQNQLTTLTTDLQSTQKLHDEQYAEQEHELQERQNHLAKCNVQLHIAQQNNSSQTETVHNTTNSLDLLRIIHDLQSQVDNLKEISQKEVVKHEELSTKLKTTQEAVNALQKICDDKKSHIQEANTLRDILEGDLIILKEESHDLGKSVHKPNSLFDEVNENRVTLQSTVTKMNDNYSDMKKKRSELMQQLQILQVEKAHLRYKCEESKEDSHFDQFVIQYTYKDFIGFLSELDKELMSLVEERNLLQSKVITAKESEVFFKALDRLDSKIHEFDSKIIKERNTNGNFQFKISEIKKELLVLQDKVKEKQRINEDLKAVIEIVDDQDVSEKLICICSVQKNLGND